MPAARRPLAALLAALTLALLAQPATASPAQPAGPDGLTTEGTANYEFCPNGNCVAGLVTTQVYGVKVYDDDTAATLYYYGRGKSHRQYGAQRVRAYYVRLYAIRPDGSYVLLAANETDVLDAAGAVGRRTPAAYTSDDPCDLRVKYSIGIRWNDGTLGARIAWSQVFTNEDNPSCT
jgi:hypothetical protein